MIPGEIITKDEVITLNSHRDSIHITLQILVTALSIEEAITIFMRPIMP